MQYEVDFSYKLTEYGIINLEATDVREAEELAMEQIKEMYTDISDIQLEAIRPYNGI